MVARGKDGEGIIREFEMEMITLLYLKWITSNIAHETLLNVMWRGAWESSLGENEHIYMYD